LEQYIKNEAFPTVSCTVDYNNTTNPNTNYILIRKVFSTLLKQVILN